MAPLFKNLENMTLKKRVLAVSSVTLLLLCLFTGCKDRNKVEATPEESMTLSAADTTQVVDLMNRYFDLLVNKDFDGAMSMVSQLRNDSLVEMDSDMQKHYQMGMKIVSPIRYQLESIIFRTESDCLIRYSAVLFDKESSDDNRPNKMFYAIKPVRINGEWHLTVADDNDMNTRDSKIDKF